MVMLAVPGDVQVEAVANGVVLHEEAFEVVHMKNWTVPSPLLGARPAAAGWMSAATVAVRVAMSAPEFVLSAKEMVVGTVYSAAVE